MKKRVGILTQDLSLYNKLRLLLRNVADVDLIELDHSVNLYAITFADIDSSDDYPRNAITMSLI